MNEPLLARYREAQSLLEVAVGDTAFVRHRIGEIVREVMTDAGRYGSRGVPLLATALGRNEDTLYNWARVVESWPREVFERLMERRTPHGVPLSITHLVILAGVDDAGRRSRLLEEVFVHGLSVKAVRRMIERRCDVPPSDEDQDESAMGRRLLTRLSNTAAAALARTTRLAESFQNLPDDELRDPDFINFFARSIAQQRDIAEGLSEMIKGLATKLEQLKGQSDRAKPVRRRGSGQRLGDNRPRRSRAAVPRRLGR